jgi:hypothetical protein
MRSAFTSACRRGLVVTADPSAVTTPEGRREPEPSPEPQKNGAKNFGRFSFGPSAGALRLVPPRSCPRFGPLREGLA